MKITTSMNIVVAAIAMGMTVHAAVAQTTDSRAMGTEKSAVPANQRMNYSDRDRMTSWSSEKEMLERSLKVGATTESYRKILADKGYTITSINDDTADYVEYEVVKGEHSFEVQIDRDRTSRLSSKVDVDRNLWRTDATKQALRSGKAVAASTPMTDGAAYSDRANSKAWADQKQQLETRLPPGKAVAFYADELKKMGYQITSTNDRDKDYVEVEIVKGRDSYEVQMDVDGAGKVSKVDVTSNMWQTEATEKALDQAK